MHRLRVQCLGLRTRNMKWLSTGSRRHRSGSLVAVTTVAEELVV